MVTYGVRIESPYFVARIEVEERTVVMAAPIVGFMRGWNAHGAAAYIKRKGWTTTILR
jgi:hypothetical protein